MSIVLSVNQSITQIRPQPKEWVIHFSHEYRPLSAYQLLVVVLQSSFIPAFPKEEIQDAASRQGCQFYNFYDCAKFSSKFHQSCKTYYARFHKLYRGCHVRMIFSDFSGGLIQLDFPNFRRVVALLDYFGGQGGEQARLPQVLPLR